MTSPLIQPSGPKPRLRLHVSAAAAAALQAGHPWLYNESIRQQNRVGELGELAAVYGPKDRFLAIGLFDPDSPLRVRVLHAGPPMAIDSAWWRERLRAALARRRGLFDEQTTGFRWVHGESDGWPGLVLDRYGETLVIKLYTGAWLRHWSEIRARIEEELQPSRIVLRLSRNIQAKSKEHFPFFDGQVLSGSVSTEPVVFLESGLRFEADVVRGQKTGFFLDQRDNRRRVEELARGRDLLNLFSFSGGFSLYAARGGARSVTNVDLSSHALASARRNFSLNAVDSAVRGCQNSLVQADVFDWLRTSQKPEFDLIVLDPPSLAKRDVEKKGALEAYQGMVRNTLPRLRSHGILVAASCSAHVASSDFFNAVRDSVGGSGRRFVELARVLHPADHPAAFAEAEYLKCIYLRL